MKKMLIVIAIILYCYNINAQMNDQHIIYEDYNQFKPILIKTNSTGMETYNGVYIPGYFVCQTGDLMNHPPFCMKPDSIGLEFLELGTNLRIHFDGAPDNIWPGFQDFRFKCPLLTWQWNEIPKLTYILEDAKQIEKMKLVLCGKIMRGAKNIGGFILYVDIDSPDLTGINDLKVFPELESVNSVELYTNNSWIFCGTKKGTTKTGKKGVIFRINSMDIPLNCNDMSVVWSYEFWNNSTLYNNVLYTNNTYLNKIKHINKSNFAIVGTTNESPFDADIVIISINANGDYKSIKANVFGKPYDEPKSTGYKEYGKSLVYDQDKLYVVGRYLQEIRPNTSNPTVTYDDLLVARLKFLNDEKYFNFNTVEWVNRYDFVPGKPYSELPEDIMISNDTRKPLAVLGNIKYIPNNHDGFILDLEKSGNAIDLSIFGGNNNDMLYSFTHSFSNTIAAAGTSNSFSTTTGYDLWIVDNLHNDIDTCFTIKPEPQYFKIELPRTRIRIANNKNPDTCFTVKVNGSLAAQDTLICDGSIIPIDSCECDDILITMTPVINNNDTCCYKITIDVTCDYLNLHTIRFKWPAWVGISPFVVTKLPGNPMTALTPGYADYPFQIDQGLLAGTYEFQLCFNPNDPLVDTNYLYTTPWCRIPGVYFSEGPNTPVLCDRFPWLCCPPCPEIGDVSIDCDSLYSNEFPMYEVCANINYTGPQKDFYIDYSGPGIGGTYTNTISSSGTFCFNIIDYQTLAPGTVITLELYFLNSAGNKICISTKDIYIPNCCPRYTNVNVACSNMTYQGQSYNLTFDVTNQWSSPTDLALSTTCGIVNPSQVTINPGLNTVSLIFTNNNNCSSTCLSSNTTLGNDTICYHFECFELPQCPDSACVIETISEDSICCCYDISIINPASTDIQSITLNTFGGSVKSWSHGNDCGMGIQLNLPSNNLAWNFDPPCSNNILWEVCFNPSTSSGWVYTYWSVTYTNGTVCNYIDSIQCDRAPVTQCDTISSYTFPDFNLNLIHRRIIITNLKEPQSPICAVYVNYDPTNLATGLPAPTSGGELRDNLGTLYGNTYWDVPYNHIFLDGTTGPFLCNHGENISFNIGINYSSNPNYNPMWDGIISFTIIHCDGDTCLGYAIPDGTTWTVENPMKHKSYMQVSDDFRYILDSMVVLELIAKASNLPDGEKIKSIAVYPIATEKQGQKNADDIQAIGELKLFAITGSKLFQGEQKKNEFSITRQGENTALFELMKATNLENDSLKLQLVFTTKEKIKNITLAWVAMNESGNIIDGDTLNAMITSVKQINGLDYNIGDIQIIKTYPIPADNKVSVEFYLAKDDFVTVELLDNNGKFVKTVERNFSAIGKNTISISTSDILSSVYYIRLTTSNGSSVITKMIRIK